MTSSLRGVDDEPSWVLALTGGEDRFLPDWAEIGGRHSEVKHMTHTTANKTDDTHLNCDFIENPGVVMAKVERRKRQAAGLMLPESRSVVSVVLKNYTGFGFGGHPGW